jgi:DNA-binding transcriptional MocR family regulator
MLSAMDKNLSHTCSWSKPKGGFFIWVTLPASVGAKTLFDACIRKNVAFVTGHAFCEPGKGDRHIRLAFSNAALADIEKGIQVIGDAVKDIDSVK